MSPPPARVRLIALVVVITGVPLALALLDMLSADQLRDLVEPAGPFAPLVYVLLGGLLGAVFIPGPVLAATSGLLFGPALGTVVTVGSALVTTLLCREAGRRAGADGARDLLGRHAETIDRAATEHGTVVVLVQRMTPGVPDAPLSYAFGALGLSVRQVVVGTAIGTLPRAFSYTALGASVADPRSPLAVAGVAGLVLSAVVGAELTRRAWRRARRPMP